MNFDAQKKGHSVRGAIHGTELRPSLHLGEVAIQKGAFESPGIKFVNFTYLKEFFLQRLTLVVSQWSLIESKSTQISSTLLSILTDLNNAVACVVSTRPLSFKSSYPCTNHLVIVPGVLMRIGITVTFMVPGIFKSMYLSLFSLSFSFTLQSVGTEKSTIRQVLFFFLFDSHKFWSSGRDQVVSLYLKIPKNFARHIFQG